MRPHGTAVIGTPLGPGPRSATAATPSPRRRSHKPRGWLRAASRDRRRAEPAGPLGRRLPMPDLPSGTVTLLFTDIEGSPRLLQRLGERYAGVLAEHERLLRAAFAAHGGHEVDTQGDAFFVVFTRSASAVHAAVEAQRALAAHEWPEWEVVRVRIGLHTGEPAVTGGRYVGLDVHRAARVCNAGHGGQVLLSQTTRDLVARDLPAGVTLRDLGLHRLRDLTQAEHLYQ